MNIKFFISFFLLTASLISSEFNYENKSFFLTNKHPIKANLDQIFANPYVLYDQGTVDKAGFKTLYCQPSGMRVLSHPLLPGWLVKAYLLNERRSRSKTWHLDRCKGAEDIRNLIKRYKIKYFTVPRKKIYFPPMTKEAVLIVKDMDLVSRKESKKAWKTIVTKEHIDELYLILGHGFASCCLPHNIPYTKNGTFACIDTAYAARKHKLYRASGYLNNEMRAYWEELAEIPSIYWK